MKALVSMSFSPTSLFVVRRLSDLGYAVTAVDSHERSYASYSKAVVQRIVAPSMRDDPMGFANCILDELRRDTYDIFFPVFECSFLMAYFQDTIRQYTRMVSMPYETILETHSKARLQDLGHKAGVSVIEETLMPRSMEEAAEMCQSVSGPVIIKGPTSRNAHGQAIIQDPADLFTIYRSLVVREGWEESPPLIQRFVRGSLISSVNLAQQGERVGGVVFRALRTVPVAGGTSSYRQTIDSPVCEQYDRQLISTLGWTGFISFDYMEDEQTGALYLIDCNPRIAPGVALGYFAGVDLIKVYLEIARDFHPGPMPGASASIRSKLQFLDIGWILNILKDQKLSASQKWAHFLNWSKREKCHDDIADWQDIRPVAALYTFLLRNLGSLMGPKGGEFFYKHVLFDEKTFRDQLQGIS